MGRKSSAKAQPRQDPPGGAPPDPRRFPVWLLAVVAIIVIAGGVLYLRNDGTPASATDTQAAREPEPVPAVNQTPHPQAALPPLPFSPTPPARPTEVVREAYKFAAEHPEVLSYVPCYCGCERSGHRGNEDCFVTARAANGDVTEWEPHGMT